MSQKLKHPILNFELLMTCISEYLSTSEDVVALMKKNCIATVINFA